MALSRISGGYSPTARTAVQRTQPAPKRPGAPEDPGVDVQPQREQQFGYGPTMQHMKGIRTPEEDAAYGANQAQVGNRWDTIFNDPRFQQQAPQIQQMIAGANGNQATLKNAMMQSQAMMNGIRRDNQFGISHGDPAAGYPVPSSSIGYSHGPGRPDYNGGSPSPSPLPGMPPVAGQRGGGGGAPAGGVAMNLPSGAYNAGTSVGGGGAGQFSAMGAMSGPFASQMGMSQDVAQKLSQGMPAHLLGLPPQGGGGQMDPQMMAALYRMPGQMQGGGGGQFSAMGGMPGPFQGQMGMGSGAQQGAGGQFSAYGSQYGPFAAQMGMGGAPSSGVAMNPGFGFNAGTSVGGQWASPAGMYGGGMSTGAGAANPMMTPGRLEGRDVPFQPGGPSGPRQPIGGPGQFPIQFDPSGRGGGGQQPFQPGSYGGQLPNNMMGGMQMFPGYSPMGGGGMGGGYGGGMPPQLMQMLMQQQGGGGGYY